jgi:hypothetical protein
MPLLFSFYFIIHQKIIRHQMEEKLEKSFLQTIRLKKEDLVWVKKGKEIRIGNHLFDIKSIKENNGVCEIKGLYDQDEDLLHEQLDESQRNTDQQSQKSLLSFFFQLYTALENTLYEKINTPTLSEHSYHFSFNLPSPSLDLITPPPNV